MAQTQSSRIPIGEARPVSTTVGRTAEAKPPREASETFSAALDRDLRSRRPERQERKSSPETTKSPDEKNAASATATASATVSATAHKARMMAERPPQFVGLDEDSGWDVDLDSLTSKINALLESKAEANSDLDMMGTQDIDDSNERDFPRLWLTDVSMANQLKVEPSEELTKLSGSDTPENVSVNDAPSLQLFSDATQPNIELATEQNQQALEHTAGSGFNADSLPKFKDETVATAFDVVALPAAKLAATAPSTNAHADRSDATATANSHDAVTPEIVNSLNAEAAEISDAKENAAQPLMESASSTLAPAHQRFQSMDAQRIQERQDINSLEDSERDSASTNEDALSEIDPLFSDSEFTGDTLSGTTAASRSMPKLSLVTENIQPTNPSVDSMAAESPPSTSPILADLTSQQNVNPQLMANEFPTHSTENSIGIQPGGNRIQGTPETTASYKNIQAISEQIALKLTGDDQSLTVELEPRDLGKLEIVVSNENGQLRIHINASEASTGALFERHRDALLDYMAAQGVEFSSLELSSGGEERNESFPFEGQAENKYTGNGSWSEPEGPTLPEETKGAFSTPGKLNLKV